MEYGKFIEIKKEDAEKFMFICKAVSDDENRYFLNFVYCDGKKLIATDGRRIHIMDLGENPYNFEKKKFYKVLKSNTKEAWLVEVIYEMTFPKWEKVVPKGMHRIISFTMKSGKYNADNYINIAKLMRELSEEFAINFTFLEDLMKNVYWKVHIFEDQKAMKFVYKDLTAAIMPMDARCNLN